MSSAGKIFVFLKWAGIAAIASFQALVAILAFQPRVSEAYRLHYIARTSGCYATPAWRAAYLARPRPSHIAFAGMSGREECIYLPDGWRPPDAEGAKTKEAWARIMVPAGPAARGVILSLRAIDHDQPLRISQRGRVLWNGIVAAEGKSAVQLRLEAGDADRDGMAALDLANSAGAGDLALILYAITMD